MWLRSAKVVYKYNENNLVKNAVVYEDGRKVCSVAYAYSGDKLIKRVTKITYSQSTATAKYAYNGSALSKSVTTFSGNSFYPDGTKIVMAYALYKNGLIAKTKKVTVSDKKLNTTNTYRYDTYGFITKYTYSNDYGSGYINRKMVYSNRKLTKYRDIDHSDGEVYPDAVRAVTMKTIQVSKGIHQLQ